MNILHIEDEPWDSGMAHYAVTLAAEQARHGHHVEVWGREGSPPLAEAHNLGLETRGWGLMSWRAQRHAAALFAPRVINAHTGAAHAAALMLAYGRPCAVVRTRADARPPSATVLTRFVAGRTDAFIAANRTLEAALRASFPGAKVARVAQGIKGPDQTAELAEGPVAGMIARFDEVKGHWVLLAAAGLIKPAVPGLRIRCAGEGRLFEGLRATSANNGIEFPGRVAGKWAFMASCRVGVIPSLGSEAVSRAALEWMAMGRPVVASRVGGLSDIVEDGVTGLLVPPGEPAALAEALSSLLLDPRKAEAFGAAGRARWEKEFGLNLFYEATQRIYDDATTHLPS